jgi:transposase InsO family protein
VEVADHAEEYNHRRPHSGLNWRTPEAFAASLEDGAGAGATAVDDLR